MKEFSSFSMVSGTEFCEFCSRRLLYAGLLPIPEDFRAIEKSVNAALMNDIHLPIPIEFMFSPEVIRKALEQGKIELEDRIARINDPELPTTINLSEMYSRHLPQGCEHFAKKVRKGTKIGFSNWVVHEPAESFENFRPLFEQLKNIINIE